MASFKPWHKRVSTQGFLTTCPFTEADVSGPALEWLATRQFYRGL